jgi:ribosome-binding protein aMBF1 (putative translation factor)
MIHINRGDGNHELLSDDEFQSRYPEAYTNLKRPAPFEQFGKIMSRYRKDADISLRELAKKLDVRPSELSAIELGRVEITDALHARYLMAVTEYCNESREE